MRFVILQINADFLINQLTKYFYIRHLTPLLNFKKKLTFSVTESFRNIHFLPHINKFSQWIRCTIFQINTDLLVIFQKFNIFTHETLYLSIILKKEKKKWPSPSPTFFQTSTFYNIFTLFNSE